MKNSKIFNNGKKKFPMQTKTETDLTSYIIFLKGFRPLKKYNIGTLKGYKTSVSKRGVLFHLFY